MSEFFTRAYGARDVSFVFDGEFYAFSSFKMSKFFPLTDGACDSVCFCAAGARQMKNNFLISFTAPENAKYKVQIYGLFYEVSTSKVPKMFRSRPWRSHRYLVLLSWGVPNETSVFRTFVSDNTDLECLKTLMTVFGDIIEIIIVNLRCILRILNVQISQILRLRLRRS